MSSVLPDAPGDPFELLRGQHGGRIEKINWLRTGADNAPDVTRAGLRIAPALGRIAALDGRLCERPVSWRDVEESSRSSDFTLPDWRKTQVAHGAIRKTPQPPRKTSQPVSLPRRLPMARELSRIASRSGSGAVAPRVAVTSFDSQETLAREGVQDPLADVFAQPNRRCACASVSFRPRNSSNSARIRCSSCLRDVWFRRSGPGGRQSDGLDDGGTSRAEAGSARSNLIACIRALLRNVVP